MYYILYLHHVFYSTFSLSRYLFILSSNVYLFDEYTFFFHTCPFSYIVVKKTHYRQRLLLFSLLLSVGIITIVVQHHISRYVSDGGETEKKRIKRKVRRHRTKRRVCRRVLVCICLLSFTGIKSSYMLIYEQVNMSSLRMNSFLDKYTC